MACRVFWNSTREESFHSRALSESDFMYLTKKLDNEDVGCVFCNGKFSEDERGEIWFKCFSCSQWGTLTLQEQRAKSIYVTFIDSKQKWFSHNLKNMIFIAKNNYIL